MAQPPRKILVIQLRRIGDVILTTPALAALRRTYPDAKIDFLVEKPCDEALFGNTDISEVLIYDKSRHLRWLLDVRRRGYDMVIDFLGNPRSGLMTFLSGARVKAGPPNVFWTAAYNTLLVRSKGAVYAPAEKIKMLAPVGVPFESTNILPVLHIRPEHMAWAREELKKIVPPNGFAVAFAPVSRKITREYPPEHFAALAKMIAAACPQAAILLLWGPGEEEKAQAIAAQAGERVFTAPRTPQLGHAAALLKNCAALVTNCNGPKHIAVAVGTPTLTIHASSDPAVWTPPNNPRHLFIRRENLDCIGCQRNECPRALECLRGLPPEEVFVKFKQLLPQPPQSILK